MSDVLEIRSVWEVNKWWRLNVEDATQHIPFDSNDERSTTTPQDKSVDYVLEILQSYGLSYRQAANALIDMQRKGIVIMIPKT